MIRDNSVRTSLFTSPSRSLDHFFILFYLEFSSCYNVIIADEGFHVIGTSGWKECCKEVVAGCLSFIFYAYVPAIRHCILQSGYQP